MNHLQARKQATKAAPRQKCRQGGMEQPDPAPARNWHLPHRASHHTMPTNGTLRYSSKEHTGFSCVPIGRVAKGAAMVKQTRTRRQCISGPPTLMYRRGRRHAGYSILHTPHASILGIANPTYTCYQWYTNCSKLSTQLLLVVNSTTLHRQLCDACVYRPCYTAATCG